MKDFFFCLTIGKRRKIQKKNELKEFTENYRIHVNDQRNEHK